MIKQQSKILLFGSSGVLGGHIIRALGSAHIKYVAPSRFEFDLNNPDSIKKLLIDHNPTHVVNCVSLNGIARCYENSSLAITTNSVFPKLLEYYSVNRGFILIHFSTECVFSESLEIIPSSRKPNDPHTIYGATKLAGEPVAGNSNITIRLPLLISHVYNDQVVWRLLKRLKEGFRVKVAEDIYSTPIFAERVAYKVARVITERIEWPTAIHFSSNILMSLYDTVVYLADLHGISRNLLMRATSSEIGEVLPKPKRLGLLASDMFCTIDLD
jgi:dTDP-4-dehydrorhamnose reductase